jgi:UDP:flavonoid glycosyltransferase YjiC (YdhE family)
MSRFLLLTYPLPGHVNPALPIVRALVGHKHEVLWITGRLFQDKVEATGAQYYPLPKSVDLEGRDVYDFYPQVKRLEGLAQVKWYIKHVFLGTLTKLKRAAANHPILH